MGNLNLNTDLLANFIDGYDASYTYDQLLALRAAGKTIPDTWVTNAKKREDAAATAKARADQLAEDAAAADKARADALAAKDAEIHTILDDKLTELDTLTADATAKAKTFREARSVFNAAHNAAHGKYEEISKIIHDNYGEPEQDADGNPLPGQTFEWSLGRGVFVKGEKVREPRDY